VDINSSPQNMLLGVEWLLVESKMISQIRKDPTKSGRKSRFQIVRWRKL